MGTTQKSKYPNRGRAFDTYYTNSSGRVYRLKSGKPVTGECHCHSCLTAGILWERVPGVIVRNNRVSLVCDGPAVKVWTPELPVKPGWYWFRVTAGNMDEPERTPQVLEVRSYAGSLSVGNNPIVGHGYYENGEWAGPIELPTELK